MVEAYLGVHARERESVRQLGFDAGSCRIGLGPMQEYDGMKGKSGKMLRSERPSPPSQSPMVKPWRF